MDTNIEHEFDLKHSIPDFNDCKGTCKTPIGCTCDNADDADDAEFLDQEIEIVELVAAQIAVEKPVGAASLAVAVELSETKCLEKKKDFLLVEKKKESLCCRRTNNCCPGTHKLEVYNWLANTPGMLVDTQMVEVQFKNTRKGYYLNSNNLELNKGDIVAVEATPGHDIGEVTMTGKLVQLQMKKCNFKGEIKRVYRIAKPNDIEKSEEAKRKEHKTMLRARELAEELNLGMKISDVEFQGDGNKVIFYYIADERVDFRQLIKVYASEFRVKIEMKQIGARQEAGRVGGIGPCGRELCCSSSMSNFISVSTSAARLQEIPLNPQKLAGQCGKLKCCLNFEVDTYVEAQGKLPNRDIPLETKDATYFNFKTDVLSGTMIYSTDKHFAANLVTLHKDRVFEIIKMNRQGERPQFLQTEEQEEAERTVSHDLLDQGSITRFDSSQGGNRNRKNKPRNNDSANHPNTDRAEVRGGGRDENNRPKLNKNREGNMGERQTENVSRQIQPNRNNQQRQPIARGQNTNLGNANEANNNNRPAKNNRRNKNQNKPRNANPDAPKNNA